MDTAENKKKLKSYTHPSSTWQSLALGAVFLVIAIVIVSNRGVDFHNVSDIVPFGILLTLGIVMIIVGIHTQVSYESRIKELENKDVLTDFAQSTSVIDDRLRVGNKYLFGKRTGTIIEYSEISRVYQYIHKTNHVEDKRALKLKTTKGKELTLCSLPLHGKADEDISKIAGLITMVNPSVELGYK